MLAHWLLYAIKECILITDEKLQNCDFSRGNMYCNINLPASKRSLQTAQQDPQCQNCNFSCIVQIQFTCFFFFLKTLIEAAIPSKSAISTIQISQVVLLTHTKNFFFFFFLKESANKMKDCRSQLPQMCQAEDPVGSPALRTASSQHTGGYLPLMYCQDTLSYANIYIHTHKLYSTGSASPCSKADTTQALYHIQTAHTWMSKEHRKHIT